VYQNHGHATDNAAQNSENISCVKRVEIWIDEDVNSCEAYADQEEFSLFDRSSEEEERKESNEERERVEKDNGICQGYQSDGFEQTKKGEGSEKPSQNENLCAVPF
jgi:hypothetical protein